MKQHFANRHIVNFLKHTVGNIFVKKYNVHFNSDEIKDLEPPYIILSNHPTALDPFLISMPVHYPIHFVANDQYFRSFILRNLLKLVGAIPKTKFLSDSTAVKHIIKVTKRKGIIGIFPEGTRNWDGETLEILFATAKLVKSLKIPVVCVVEKGGTLSKPRWAKKSRQGQIDITYQRVLSPEDIKSKSLEEIYNIIYTHLHYDEYKEQESKMIEYKGEKRAENLELFLFICPKCKSIATLQSKNNIFYCSECDLTVEYNNYGYFEWKSKVDDSFKSPKEWNKWQVDYLRELIYQSKDSDAPIFKDKNVFLKRANRFKPLKKIRFGNLILYHDRLVFRSVLGDLHVFEFNKITGLDVQSKNEFEFYHNGLLSRFVFKFSNISSYKWVTGIQLLEQINNEEDNGTIPLASS